MDQNFQTSFIPKKALAEDRVERPKSVSIFLFLGTILLIASIIGAGFVYFYKTTVERKIVQQKADLQKAEGAFEGDFIQELQTIDRRINAASEVLSNHIIVSPIFDALSQSTLKSIQFTKFSYNVVGSGTSAEVRVQMSGRATGYTAVAIESDELTKNKYIKDPVFSNLNLDDQGNILFELTFSVDPKLVLFNEVIAKQMSGTIDTTNTQVAPPAGQNQGAVSFPPITQ